jgi:hypothetical protein
MDISAESDEDSWQVPGTPPAEDDEMNLDEDEVASAQGDEDDEMGDDDDEVQVPLRRGVGGGAAKKAKKAVTVAQHKAPQDFVKSVASRLAVPAASAGDAAAASKRPRSVYPPGSVELPVVTPGTAAELAAQGKSLYAVYAKYVLNPLPPRGGRNLGFQFFVDKALKGHGKCSVGCGCLIKGRRFVKGLEFTSNASALADLLGRYYERGCSHQAAQPVERSRGRPGSHHVSTVASVPSRVGCGSRSEAVERCVSSYCTCVRARASRSRSRTCLGPRKGRSMEEHARTDGL